MKNLNELRQKAKTLHGEYSAILEKALAESRGMTEAEKKDHDEKRAAYLSLQETIAAAEKAEEEARKLGAPATPVVPDPAGETRETTEIKVGAERETKKPFRSLGEQLMAVRAAADPSRPTVDPRLFGIHEEARAATGLSESVPSDGGFLVQKDYVPGLLEKTYAVGSLISRVDSLPVGPNSNGIKLNAVAETSRVDGSRLGGVKAYWTDEAGVKTPSKPEFRKMELNLHKVVGLVYATDELLQDAVALGAWVDKNLPTELRFRVEDAIINGTGAGQPLGILPGGSLVTVLKEVGQLANTIVYDNIVKMYARHYSSLPTYVINPATYPKVWLINQDTIPQLFTMGLTVGTGGAPVFVPANGAAGQPFNMLLGLPILPIEYCPTLGTLGDIILADLSEYQMIDKGGIKSDFSIHVRFLYDESIFRFVYRVDGQPKWNSALTPFKGTNTVSPFVALETRA